MSAKESLGGGTLHEGARLGIDWRAEEIVGGGVANVQLDGGIELGEFDEIGLEKVGSLSRRLRGEGFGAKLIDAFQRRDAEDAAGNSADVATLEDGATDLDLRGVAGCVASEDGFFAVVEAGTAELEDVVGDWIEGVEFHPLDEALQDAVFFEDVEDVVIPAVFAEETLEFFGGIGGGHGDVDFFAGLGVANLQTFGGDFYFLAVALETVDDEVVAFAGFAQFEF